MSLKKTTIIIVLVCIVSINAFVLVPRIHAQWVVSAPALEGMEVRQWIMNELQGLWRGALSQTVFNSLNYFLQKLAYDAAIWVSSGGQGQGPLFEYKDFGSYISDVALDTAASAIDELSDGWPVDLCSPSLDFLPEVSMSIQLGVVQTYEPRPRCSWNELSANWDQFIAENSSGEVLAEYARSIRPGEGGLGSILALHEKIATEQAKKSQGAIEARREGGGIKPVVGVSGYIESPVTLVEEELRNRFVRAPQRGTEQSVENVLASADSWISMGLNVGSLFLNTLTSNLFSNIMEGMFDTGELISERGSLWDLGGSGTEPSGGRIAAEEIFADLLTPSILEVTNYSPLSEFTTCPNERGSQNCVMDASFAAALSQSAGGNTITVKDALQKGYLRGNWPLIPLEDKSRNQDPNCYTYGYCYSNLVKLRKARIIPIGWELAANSMANDIGNPITLGEVVNGFDDCGSDTTDPSPWCHLINPNWILKFPITQCKLKVSGSRLASAEGDLRESMCVDTPSCIEEDNDGKCLGAWGYCTREKNIWRMTADTCSAEYSSCETLTNREGKKVSYLKNTLDYDNCNVGNVGCKWYSRSKTGDSWNPADRIYLNKNVEMCDASFAGCSDLIRKGSGVSKNYIKNSSFEIDEDGDDLPDEWSWRGIGASAYSVDG
ncbi:MAG: hypothetical protein U9P90_00535, partial [Patescibacteria group bacterium]|nr:hypothetical protein [Patescibacteria group bacterium]